MSKQAKTKGSMKSMDDRKKHLTKTAATKICQDVWFTKAIEGCGGRTCSCSAATADGGQLQRSCRLREAFFDSGVKVEKSKIVQRMNGSATTSSVSQQAWQKQESE